MLRECNRLSRVVGTLGLVLGVGVVAPVPVQASPAGLAVQTASPGQLPDRWRLELEYFALLQQLDPVQSSVLGLPVAGWGLGPSSPVEVRAAADAWRALGVSANQLLAAEERSLDLALIAYDADRRVFDLDSLRVWERDPGYPFRAIAEGLNTILLNGALGPSERLARIVAREADIPRFLAGAAGHTGVPPRFLCEQAISEGEALSNFLLFGVQAAVATPEDSVLTQELVQVTARALDAVWAYRQHLIREVLPRSTGAFALGESLYAAQLRHVEGMTLPVAGLRDEASAEVERLSRRFSLACDRIAPGEGPWAALQRLAKDRPAPGNLVGFCRTTVRELHAHCRRSPLLPPPPAHGNLEVGPSPRFSSWANASLAVPGPHAGELSLNAEGTEAVFVPDVPFQAGELVTLTVAKGLVRTGGGVTTRGWCSNFWVRSEPGVLAPPLSPPIPIRRPGERQVKAYGAHAGD